MRPVLYLTLAALLVILAVVGVIEAAGFRIEYETLERQRMQDQLDEAIDRWETNTTTRIGDIRQRLLETTSRDAILQNARRQGHWLDALYIWDGAERIWPPDAPPQDLTPVTTDPCIVAATVTGPGDTEDLAARRLSSCIRGLDAVSAYATSEAVVHYWKAGNLNGAAWLLSQFPHLALLHLDQSVPTDISPYLLLLLRLEYIQTLEEKGDHARAGALVSSTVAEMVLQDGPIVDQIDDLYDYPLRPALQTGLTLRGLPLDTDDAWQRALRRASAWRALRDRRWNRDTLAALSGGPRLEIGTETDPPYLLYVERPDTTTRVVALQLDEEALLRDFFREFSRSQQRVVSVRDANGGLIAGSTGPLLVYRNFNHILPAYLQAGFTEDGLPHSSQDRALLIQLLLIGLGLCVGVAALWGMVRSDRQTVALMERQRDFMTRVTHELKTPLAGIRLMAENLEFGTYREPEQIEQCAQRIIHEADRLHARVDEVLIAARGAVPQAPVRADAAALLRELVETWRPRLDTVGGTITVEAPDALVILVKPPLLRDALTNLIDNALKYRHPDRPLRVHARLQADRRQVVFEIIDNGIGVPPALRHAVFERFRRVEGPGRGKSGGHGLGLAFVAEAARAHRGRAECKDGVEGGARFIFRFPRRS